MITAPSPDVRQASACPVPSTIISTTVNSHGSAQLSTGSTCRLVPPEASLLQQIHGKNSPLPASSPISSHTIAPAAPPALSDSYHCCTPCFFTASQSLTRRFLHKPFPGQTLEPDEIARPVHGAMHGARTALWIPVLLSIRQSLSDREALSISPGQVHWLMIAALLHDSGREGEGSDTAEWERASAEQCEDHLLAMHCPYPLIAACVSGIINKDRPDRSNKTVIEKLIHDADCLEIMRTADGNLFDLARLDLHQDYGAGIQAGLYSLASQVRTIIAGQHDLWGSTRIINSETGFYESNDQRVQHNYSSPGKEQAEFAGNALLYQLCFLAKHAPDLWQLYRDATPTPAADSYCFPGQDSDFLLTGVNGKISTNSEYTIRERKDPESARNEVLMATIARQLGLNIPEIRLITNAGRTFIVSRPVSGHTVTKEHCQQIPAQQLATLYLIAAITGNSNIFGPDFSQTVMTDQGQLVPLDWTEAGEFGPPGGEKRKAGTCHCCSRCPGLLSAGC